MGRTAVVAGTATAVSGRVARRQQAKMVAQQQAVGSSAPAPPASPPATGQTDDLELLAKLGELHQQGVLTDEEFAAKKAQILGL